MATNNVVIDLSHNNGNVDLTRAQRDGIGVKLPAACKCLAKLRNHAFIPRVLRKGTFFSNLFPRALPRQSLFHSTSFAWLQVIRVTFDFSNNVFRLNLTFEPAKRIL